MRLSSDPTDGSAIHLYDSVGIPRLGVLANTDGTNMQFNPPSTPSIIVVADKEKVISKITNAQGNDLITLVAGDKMRLLGLGNPDGKAAISLVSLRDGFRNLIAINNKDGGKAVELDYDNRSSTGITFYDNAEAFAAGFSTGGRIGKHYMVIYDKGQPVWGVP